MSDNVKSLTAIAINSYFCRLTFSFPIITIVQHLDYIHVYLCKYISEYIQGIMFLGKHVIFLQIMYTYHKYIIY